MAETRRKFDQDFRKGAVRLVRETGKPIAAVTVDAMHAQREHAKNLVTEKNAHCILPVQYNQPGLYA